MPTPTDFPTGAPLWVDLISSDAEGVLPFYEQLFGWTPTRTGPEFGNYIVLSLGDRQLGGLIQGQPAGGADDIDGSELWRVYLETGDAETTAQAITGAGGMVLQGPHVVGPLGSMLVAIDNDRGVVGGWQRGENRGFQVVAEPGAPAWFELHTTSYDDAVQFYQQAFGWQTTTMADSGGFRYTQLLVDGSPYAGILDASAFWEAGAPAKWLVYFLVDDVDGARASAVQLGGAALDEPADSPFGRIATLADPAGAVFKIVGAMPTPA
ncbi:hypothetical protein AX769_02530 [Frondihabitans sp. PAMC 28766]|uniref:VOC family protein n=1 Tax=Frondihabitans sp. PAMC 28766 TaxID=1795630 RepID=UPI00078C2B64|nr:VOC family protein [Frondihabitans sp. PAMC 28766]AMM19214.1 hypothetical protein AX769_02530 [Frondihabitans sp. PAMC 28766]